MLLDHGTKQTAEVRPPRRRLRMAGVVGLLVLAAAAGERVMVWADRAPWSGAPMSGLPRSAALGLVLTAWSAPPAHPASDGDATAGARIVQIVPASAAAAAGLTPGDVIVGMDGCKIAAPHDVEKIIATAARAGRSTVPLLVLRSGKVYYLVLTFGN